MAEPVVNGAPDASNRTPPKGAARPKRNRGGRPELPPEERRDRQLGVRLNDAEWQRLQERAGAIPPASYLRVAALDGLPPVVPEVNREALAQLPALARNVNQIATKLNTGRIGELTGPDRVLLDQVRAALVALQQSLVGRGGAVARRAAQVASGAEPPIGGPIEPPVEVFAQLSPEQDAERARQPAAREAARPAVLDAARALFRRRGAPS